MNLTAIQGNIVSMRGNLLAMDARKPFIIEIDTIKGNGFNSFTLPLTNHTTDIYVKVSDGQRFTISNYLDAKRIINFASAGVYTIELRGQCGWSFNNTGDCQKITEVIKGGNFLFNYIRAGFYGCINLRSIPIDWIINAPSITTLHSLFRGCVNLDCQIPANIFSACVSITAIDSCFWDCRKLYGSIPPYLLKYCQLLTAAPNAFRACISLTGAVPDDLLKYNVALVDVGFIFSGCGVTSFSAGLFKYNTGLVYMYGIFFGCSNLDCEIPIDMLRYNVNAINLNAMFQNCIKLKGVIPVDLLRYTVKVTSIDQMFYGCNLITGFDSTLLIYMPLLKSISYLFYSCGTLDASNFYLPPSIIPNIINFTSMMEATVLTERFLGAIQPVWDYASPTATKLNAFTGQTLLVNYNDIPNEWKGL